MTREKLRIVGGIEASALGRDDQIVNKRARDLADADRLEQL
jgi:hypothetical protein